MDKEKAEKIIRVYNWIRVVVLIVFLLFLFIGLAQGQEPEVRTSLVERKLEQMERRNAYRPQFHGLLRGKCEYQPQSDAARFEVRNARLSASGCLPLRSAYKLEVDLCDESEIKMKDAWVRLCPWRTLRLTVGQQRMPFSIDAHRDPSGQFFANRSFIAKQVGDMRDVGAEAGYDLLNKEKRKILSVDAGVFNGSNLDEQKSAWFKSPGYSARLQFFPVKGFAVVPSVQHQKIASSQASYTSLDLGAFWQGKRWHVEAEYLHKKYACAAFPCCNAMNLMLIFQHRIKKEHCYIQCISCQGRYDYMQDHSSGKSGFETDADGNATSLLALTDAERHRMTLGATFSLHNPYFPTDLRLNYEKYWYPHGGAKESEQDKLVCELVIKF